MQETSNSSARIPASMGILPPVHLHLRLYSTMTFLIETTLFKKIFERDRKGFTLKESELLT